MSNPITDENEAQSVPATEPRSFVSTLLDKAKAAGQLAAKQAEKTKIQTTSLRAAHVSLGKEVFGSGKFMDEFGEIHASLTELCERIAAFKQSSDIDASSDFAAKAKAVTQTAIDTASAQALESKFPALYRKLGKLAYEKHGSKAGSKEVVSQIENQQERIRVLEEEIREIEQTHAGGMVTPRRLAIGGGIAIVAFLICAGLFLFGGKRVSNRDLEEAEIATRLIQEIERADQLWNGKQTDEAVTAYLAIIREAEGNYRAREYDLEDGTTVEGQLPRIYGRTVDYLCINGNENTAIELLKEAFYHDYQFVLKSDEAKAISPRAKQEYEQEREEAAEHREIRREREAADEIANRTKKTEGSSVVPPYWNNEWQVRHQKGVEEEMRTKHGWSEEKIRRHRSQEERWRAAAHGF